MGVSIAGGGRQAAGGLDQLAVGDWSVGSQAIERAKHKTPNIQSTIAHPPDVAYGTVNFASGVAMAIERWSERVVVVQLADDPHFGDTIDALISMIKAEPLDVVLNLSAVHHVNSSNLGRLLQLRRIQNDANRRLVLCGISNSVWSVFLLTALDKLFDYSDDVTTSLATLQMEDPH